MASGGDNITISVNVNGSQVSGGVQGVISDLQRIATSVGVMHSGMQSQNVLTAVTWDQLGQSILGNMGPLGQWLFTANNVFSLVNDGIGFVTGIANAFISAGEAVISFAESLGQIAWDGIQQGVDLLNQLSGALDAVTSTMQTAFAETAFQLNETTEKNFANWMFLWGGPNNGGGPIAEQLVQWTKKASLVMPYTRQDLMAAVTTLSAMPNQTPAGIEQDLQLLSDVASTQGRPGLTLQWAAMAAMRGSQGYSRMLLMDLNISKTQLAKFGYNEKDDTTFFPALEKYEKWKGEYGASATISTQTFWGAQTSFTDRIQNFLLAAGGWNNNATTITGDVRKGSLFGVLKADLMGISAWMDANGPTLDKLATVADALFGGAAASAGSVFAGLFNSLSRSGIAGDFFTSMQQFGTWLNSPDTQRFLTDFGNLIGNIIAPGLRDIAGTAQQFWTAFAGSGLGQDVLSTLSDLAKWLADPGTQQGFQKLGTIVSNIASGGIKAVFDMGKGFISGLTDSGAVNTLLTDAKLFGDWLGNSKNQAMLQGAAYQIGNVLGDAFNVVNAAIVMAIGSLGDFMTLVGDTGHLMTDIPGTPQWWQDLNQTLKDEKKALNDATTASGQFQAAQWTLQSVLNPPGAPPAPPGPAGQQFGKIGGVVKYDTTHTGIGGIIGGYIGGHAPQPEAAGSAIAAGIAYWIAHKNEIAGIGIGNALGGHTQGQTAGQAFATDYIAAAQQTFQQQQTGATLVQTLTNGITQQLQRGSGDTLTATLAQFIDQRTRQVIAEMLAGYDLTSNRTGRQAGGFRNGPALGF